MADMIDIGRLEYLIELQTELRNLAKPLENPLLTYLIEMACIEMVDMLASVRIDNEEIIGLNESTNLDGQRAR